MKGRDREWGGKEREEGEREGQRVGREGERVIERGEKGVSKVCGRERMGGSVGGREVVSREVIKEGRELNVLLY